jgi:hypothetical protein
VTVEEKALELVDQNRVVLLKERGGAEAIVAGHHGHYHVVATPSDVVCDCPARGECAHLLAAMVVWWERSQAEAKPW